MTCGRSRNSGTRIRKSLNPLAMGLCRNYTCLNPQPDSIAKISLLNFFLLSWVPCFGARKTSGIKIPTNFGNVLASGIAAGELWYIENDVREFYFCYTLQS